jgi:hypothetical protein
MKRSSLLMIVFLVMTLIATPSLSLAESDYEEGDGWIYQDGTLTITASDGLVNYIYHDENLIYDPPDQQSPFDVDQVVIGKNVTAVHRVPSFPRSIGYSPGVSQQPRWL